MELVWAIIGFVIVFSPVFAAIWFIWYTRNFGPITNERIQPSPRLPKTKLEEIFGM